MNALTLTNHQFEVFPHLFQVLSPTGKGLHLLKSYIPNYMKLVLYV